MLGEETRSGPLPGKSVESGDDYQSGSKQPYSKGSADLINVKASGYMKSVQIKGQWDP